MNPTGPLAGKTIVVTRPQAQAGPLAAAIATQGGVPLIFPLLEIGPAAALPPEVERAARAIVDERLQRITDVTELVLTGRVSLF